MQNCPLLYKIKLEDNLIEDFKTLECLQKYHIKKISLAGNPLVKSTPDYRDKLFGLVSSLESIDGVNRKGDKVESTVYGGEEDEEGEEGEDGLYEGEDDEEGEYHEEEDDEDDEGDYEDDDGEDDEVEKPQKKPKE